MTSHDWHPADIIAALRKKGTTLAAVTCGWPEFIDAFECPFPPMAKRRNADCSGHWCTTFAYLAEPVF